MIDWPIKSDVRRKCPTFSELSESIDRNILSGTLRKSGKDDICPWQWSDFRLFQASANLPDSITGQNTGFYYSFKPHLPN